MTPSAGRIIKFLNVNEGVLYTIIVPRRLFFATQQRIAIT
jgi:hypothetical protein